MLFLAGFFLIWVYASTLAYMVDANVGCSSTATATNSACRGLLAFVAAEVAVPLQVRLRAVVVLCPDCVISGMLLVMVACTPSKQN